MRKKNRGSHLRLFLVLLVFASLLPASPAHAGLVTITGTITDPLGRPLSNVRVVNAVSGTTALSNSAGVYRIEEDYIGTYRLVATRGGLNSPPPIEVDPVRAVSPVDITMTYVLATSLSPSAFNNSSPTTIQISATSYAPTAGQCIEWTDQASGTTVPLQLVSVNGGSSNWTGSYTVLVGRPDGPYASTLTSKDCPSGTALTNSVISTFRIDSVAPVIDSQSIIPISNGNTIFTLQPLMAGITDTGGSGVNASGSHFTLKDETSNVTTTHPVSSYSATTSWAKSAPVSMTIGHVYTVSVWASDYAGNVASASHGLAEEGGGFLVTTLATHSTTASIPSTPCVVASEIDLSSGTRTVTCSNVPLRLAGSSVDIGGSRHLGRGYVKQTYGLTTAIGLPLV